MTRYYDTGILLKLYTLEDESDAVRAFVTKGGEPLYLHAFHLSEAVSALRLKCLRKECSEEESAAAIADLEDDIASGVIRRVAIEWDDAWNVCRLLSQTHAAATGCRTLDALHVACARSLALREFVTSDSRQTALAARCGLSPVNPLR